MLNNPGKTFMPFPDMGYVYDLSAPGRYRVTVRLSRDVKWTDTFTLTREFSVK